MEVIEIKHIPEMTVAGIDFAFGVGEMTKNSSSWILNKWKHNNEERVWGSFSTLFSDKSTKVKELVVQPGNGTSFQRHFKRSEIWLINRGSCLIYYSQNISDKRMTRELNTFDYYLALRDIGIKLQILLAIHVT